jgi:diaminohydroxyphosphoribosylaminopyrimidine deaminase/5-amino-6-(5-phosphoribosylamino)uracil reductase
MTAPRPTVTLKIATSLDGRIATPSGESRWITGEASREEVHRLRAAHDAVLVGSQTVLDDDPELTVRLPGYEGPQPLRVVADARLRTPTTARVLGSPHGAFLLLSNVDAPVFDAWLARFADETHGRPRTGIVIRSQCAPDPRGGGVDPAEALGAIAEQVTTLRRLYRSTADAPPAVLLEGGGKLAASFLRAGLIDRIEWFRAPIVLGGDAKPALAALELSKLADAPRWKRLDVRTLGDDLWERYERLA